MYNYPIYEIQLEEGVRISVGRSSLQYRNK